MTTTSRREFIRDQVDAVAADLQLRLQHLVLPADRIGRQHDATGRLTAKLIEELKAGLPLCEHLRGAPARATWTPGATSLNCYLDTVSFGALNLGTSTCDLCAAEVGATKVLPAFTAAGPVMVHAGLCQRCRNKPAADRYDARAARRTVLEQLVRRYEGRP